MLHMVLRANLSFHSPDYSSPISYGPYDMGHITDRQAKNYLKKFENLLI